MSGNKMAISSLKVTMMRLPVVFTDDKGVSEICKKGYNGYI